MLCAWGYVQCIVFLESLSYDLIRKKNFNVPDRFWVVKAMSRPHRTTSLKDQFFLYLLKLNVTYIGENKIQIEIKLCKHTVLSAIHCNQRSLHAPAFSYWAYIMASIRLTLQVSYLSRRSHVRYTFHLFTQCIYMDKRGRLSLRDGFFLFSVSVSSSCSMGTRIGCWYHLV